MINNNISLDICQELHDKTARGRERPWAKYKRLNGYIAMAYDDVDIKKADRLRQCATWLEFAVEGDNMRLHNANFCRVRLCPICSWRKSLKTYAQVRACMAELGNDYNYIFVTLTIPNCLPTDLDTTLTRLMEGFNRLTKYKRVSDAVKGYYKGVEVTHNVNDDTYHPHIHCIFAVKPSYFKSRYYIKRDDWLDMWRRAMQDKSIMEVDVRRLYGNVEHACAEVSKYAIKPGEIVVDDWSLTVDTVRVLDKALNNRRFVGFGGVFKEAHKKLHLDDVEDGDLTHVEANLANADDDVRTIVYTWRTGYNQYLLDG